MYWYNKRAPPATVLWVCRQVVFLFLDLNLLTFILRRCFSTTTFAFHFYAPASFKRWTILSFQSDHKLLLSHFWWGRKEKYLCFAPSSFLLFSYLYNLSLGRSLCSGRGGQGRWPAVEHPMGCIWFCQEQFGAGAECARSVSAWFRFPLVIRESLSQLTVTGAGECTGITIALQPYTHTHAVTCTQTIKHSRRGRVSAQKHNHSQHEKGKHNQTNLHAYSKSAQASTPSRHACRHTVWFDHHGGLRGLGANSRRKRAGRGVLTFHNIATNARLRTEAGDSWNNSAHHGGGKLSEGASAEGGLLWTHSIKFYYICMNICDLMWIMPECLAWKTFEFSMLSLQMHVADVSTHCYCHTALSSWSAQGYA